MAQNSFAAPSARVLAASLLSALTAMAAVSAPALASGDDDMLKPDQLQTTGVSSNPANDSGVFLGAGLGFGQARTTEPGSSPGFTVLGSFEPGYQINRGTWSRVELSGQFMTGRMQFRNKTDLGGKTTMGLNFGALAKVGYGYSLGSKMFGIARVGVGPVQATWKGDIGSDTYESSSALNGIATLVAWQIVAPVSDSLDLTGGISFMHMEFDLGKIKSGGSTINQDRPVIVNVPQAELGLRVRI
jgi:hypothetical protein